MSRLPPYMKITQHVHLSFLHNLRLGSSVVVVALERLKAGARSSTRSSSKKWKAANCSEFG